MNFFSLIASAVSRFFTRNQQKPAISQEMQTQCQLWHDVYINQGAWLKHRNITSLRLPTAITSELARLVLSESEFMANASEYQEILDDFREQFRDAFEIALSFGGMMCKPYLSHGKICMDLIRADCFLPVAFAGKLMTSAVFVSKKTVGNCYYTLLEYHEFQSESHTHRIQNKVCKSLHPDHIGMECSPDEVPEWAELAPEIVFKNIEKPLFSYFRVPCANDIDLDSPLGVSVYARAVDLIRQADE